MQHWRRRSALAATFLALSTALTPLASVAGTVTPVELADAQPMAVPGSEAGAMRSWVQLVWNPVSRTLERVSYTAFDPIPSLGLELQWLPDDAAATDGGPLEGKGVLSFRRPGAPAYDPRAIVAQYRGSFAGGQAAGFGEFVDRSGFAYAGEWRDGLMEGEGRLLLANGAEYVGAFRAGRPEGTGTFIDSTGALYEGGFAGGAREGRGIFVPAIGDAFRADWKNGAEIPGTRHLLPIGETPYPRISTAQFAEVEGLRIGIIAERRPHNYEVGIDPMNYTSRSDGAVLNIMPDDQRLLDAWHGTAPIDLTAAELDSFNSPFTVPSFLGAHERFEPLSLVFEIENSTPEPISLVGGFLNVEKSARNPEPAMQVRPFPRDPCAGIIEFLPRFFIDNFGWTPAIDAELNVSAASGDGRVQGRAMNVPLGEIADSTMADVTAQLRDLGLNTDYLGSEKLICTDPNDERLCLAELRQSGHFGELADYISLDYMTVTVNVKGTLDYQWAASDGTLSKKSSPFSVILPIASVANDAECGEGGEIIPVSHDPFMLKLDQEGYRIAIPFAGDVAPGFTARWRIELQAPETSEHDFQLVLALADGRQVASRPVHLTYFIPPRKNVRMP